MAVKKVSITEQIMSLHWLLEKTRPGLQSLARQGKLGQGVVLDMIEVEGRFERIEAIEKTLEFLNKPEIQDVLRKHFGGS